MTKIYNIIITVFISSFVIASEWIGIDSVNPVRFEAKSLNSDIETSEVQFRLNGYTLTEIETPWGTQYKVETEGGSSIMDLGAPDLDQTFASVIIPDNAQMSLEVISSSYIEIENIDIAPSKGNFSRSISPSDVPFNRGDVYAEDQFYPGKLADLRDPYILRDFRGQTVVSYPFQYNPVSKVLRIYTNITVRLSSDGEGQKNVLARSSSLNKIDSEFNSIYQNQFINFEDNQTRFEYLVDQGNMLVICYDAFMGEMEPFVEWKNRKGIPTEMVSVSSIGSSSSAIENYVSDYYYDNGLTFLLLVGDIAQIPSPSISGSASDPSYGFISGNDSYAEVIVGRFSGSTPSHIATQVERSLTYEQNPSQTSHFNNALGIASNQGPGMNGYSDDDFNDWLWNTLISDVYGSYQGIYDSNGGNANQGLSAVNSGVGIINYTGHGSISSWGNGAPISASQVNSLTNNNKLPFVITVGCNVGEFNSTNECFTESWLRANNNGQPTGAVAHLGSTISQSWEPPMHGQWAMNAIITDNYDNNFTKTVGGISVNGCMHMNDAQGSSGINETNYWTLFGDPSLNLRTDAPLDLSVNHDGVILIGQPEYVVDVGVNGALVAISQNGNLLGSAYSDGGVAIIPLGNASNNPGTVDLVITYYNAYTYEETLNILSPEGAYVTVSNVSVDYGSDNTISAGETIELILTLENLGNENSGDVVVTMDEEDPYISIISGDSSINSLQEGQIELVPLSFSVSNSAPYGHQFSINLYLESDENSWSNSLSLSLEALVESFEQSPVFSWISSGDADWSLNSNYSNTGELSMSSGQIGDNSESSIEVNVDVIQGGNIAFSYRVSSEYSPSGSNFYDGLTFYIDGQQVGQYQPTASGQYPWTAVSYPVSEGNHTFKWTYSKDGGGGSTDCFNTGCDDAAFIDDIVFPPVESQFNGVVGDVNGDAVVNVLDVIQTVNMALGSQNPDYNTADLNSDGIINVLDIVLIVNIVLGPRVSDATEASVNIYNDSVCISGNGAISGIQMKISHSHDFAFELTDKSMISDFITTENVTELIVILPEEDHVMSFSGDFEIDEIYIVNSYEEIDVVLPSNIELGSAYPNPFNPVTSLDIYLDQDSYVSVSVYDVRGYLVSSLLNSNLEKGSHTLTWNASDLPSGLYFIKAQSDYGIQTQKVTLLK